MAKDEKDQARPPDAEIGSPGPLDASGEPAGANPEPDDIARHQSLSRGASGQMAVLSEFLYRLINVAVPEVDVGDDIFVVKERDEMVTRVQAKHSKADEQKNRSYVAQFLLPWEQFDEPEDEPALVYVLAVRYKDRWSDSIVIRRSILHDLQTRYQIGSVATNEAGDPTGLKLRLVFTDQDVKAKGGYSLQRYRNAFLPWPPPLLSQDEPAPRD
jgi:hypothetical protein